MGWYRVASPRTCVSRLSKMAPGICYGRRVTTKILGCLTDGLVWLPSAPVPISVHRANSAVVLVPSRTRASLHNQPVLQPRTNIHIDSANFRFGLRFLACWASSSTCPTLFGYEVV